LRMLIKAAPSTEQGQRPDDRFPRADTCFFNLELPEYSSLEVMRKRWHVVINISSGMDGDDPQRGGDLVDESFGDEMDEDEYDEEDDDEDDGMWP